MSVIKAAQTGARIGELFGPEGEIIGAGTLAAAAIAAQIARSYNRGSSSESESKESTPLTRINPRDIQRSRPGIAQIPRTHPTQSGGQMQSSSEGLRQRRPVVVPIETPESGEASAFLPSSSVSPFQQPPPEHTPQARTTVVERTLHDINRYGRKPLLAATAAGIVGSVVTAPSTVGRTIKSVPPDPDETKSPTIPGGSNTTPPEGPLEHMPRPIHRPAHQAVDMGQPHFTSNRPSPISTPKVDRRYVGNYKFPLGAYNYVDYDKFTRNNTLKSLA